MNSPVKYVDPSGQWSVLSFLDSMGPFQLSYPILETIMWGVLDLRGLLLAIAASGPAGTAAYVTIVAWGAIVIGTAIGAVEIFMNLSFLSLPAKIFLMACWISVEVFMYYAAAAVILALTAAAGGPELGALPMYAMVLATASVAFTSYVLWLIDQTLTDKLSAP